MIAKIRHSFTKLLKQPIFLAGLIFLLISVVWYFLEPGFEPLLALIATISFIMATAANADIFRLSEVSLRNIEIARAKVEAEPAKAKPAWDLATAKLEAYLALNLKQISSIFYTSIIVMLVGFIFIMIATFLALQNPNVITPAIIAGIGGVITEFIGATFLLLYRSAIEHSGKYINTLDKTSSVGVAIQILDNITTENDEKAKDKITEAKIEIAKLLLNQPKVAVG